MSGLVLAADRVSLDEPCYCLSEANQQSPGYKGFHRYRIITVIRNDRKADYREDLGPTGAFNGMREFNLMGGVTSEDTGKIEIFHTVGELLDIAMWARYDCKPPEFEPSDLIGRWMNQFEEQERQRRKSSTIGALARIQRG